MNTSFIIDRAGKIILKAYRLHSNHSHSPHDFWDEFLDKVGLEGAFPVADTELGKLAAITAMELNYPEVSRAVVLRGAEVLLHVSSDGIVDRSVKRARAIENEAYVVSANTAGRKGIHPSMDVGSCVIDWRGEVLAQLPQNAEGNCVGPVDIAELRAKRGDMDLVYKGRGPNYLARMRVEMFRDVYGKTTIFPPNRYRKDFPVNQTVDMKPQADLFTEARENMKRLGIAVTYD
jgi:predicted amidohydrolase